MRLSPRAKKSKALEAYNEIHIDEGGLGVCCEIFDIRLVFGALRLIVDITRSPLLRFAFCPSHYLVGCGEKSGKILGVSY